MVIRGDVMVVRIYQDVVWGCLQDSSLEIGFVSEDECVVEEVVGERLLDKELAIFILILRANAGTGEKPSSMGATLNSRQTGHNTEDVYGAFEIGIWSLSRPIYKRQKRGRHSFELQLLSLNIGTHICWKALASVRCRSLYSFL